MTLFPPHTQRRLLDTGKATLVLPMEPQPDEVRGRAASGLTFVMAGEPHDERWLVERFSPHQPGDVLRIQPNDLNQKTAPWIDPKATVTSVEAKKVAEVTRDEWIAFGWFPLRQPENWPEMRWVQWQIEQRPDDVDGVEDLLFEEAWCWLIEVERKDEKP